MEAEEVSPALVFALGHLDGGFHLLNISNCQVFVRCKLYVKKALVHCTEIKFYTQVESPQEENDDGNYYKQENDWLWVLCGIAQSTTDFECFVARQTDFECFVAWQTDFECFVAWQTDFEWFVARQIDFECLVAWQTDFECFVARQTDFECFVARQTECFVARQTDFECLVARQTDWVLCGTADWLWVFCGMADWLWVLCGNKERKTVTDWCFVVQRRHQAAGQHTVAQDQQSLPAVWRQAGGGGWDHHLRGRWVCHHAEWRDPGVSRWAWSGSGGRAPLRFSPMDQGKQGLGWVSVCSLSWLVAELHSPTSGSLLIKRCTLAADFKASSSVVLWTDTKTGLV